MKRFTILLIVAALAACSTDRATAPTARIPGAPSLTLAAPTGLVIDGVSGLTVSAHWDAVAGANGYYLALSDASDAQSTKKYQIVYGGATTSGSITAYDGEAGCYLVSVFAWSLTDTDSPFATVGPVEVGAPCPTAVLTMKRRGKK